MKPQEKQMNEKEYKELSNNSASINYEIRELVDKDHGIKYFLYESINKNLIVKAFYDPLDADYIAYALKLNVLGDKVDKFNTNRILKDGTDWTSDKFSNWVINGDTTQYVYVKPITKKEEKDSDKWLETFLKLYNRASDIYIYSGLGEYYFKIEDKWHKLGYNKIANSEFNKKYPEKFSDVRMLELKDQFPDLYLPPAERDTILIKQVKYISKFFEKSDRGDAFNYSAGWWYFDIYMPGGDTLKIKRFASFRDPEMKLYKIPKELGGRDDVLFIIQEPNEIHPEQTGGMYVIRPKNYKETPQYKEQEAKELEKEKKQKQKKSQEAVRKRRSFLPEQ
ncbi:hypothetical protein [Aequorivita capsosiphonis]|uniref:hypothetical protein n=1 Tax=Aequorivita capsosiphonis TaxID=487317 RepID=UPI000421543B|nr:hypothetical protein [Aequorivita capsosiphonis]